MNPPRRLLVSMDEQTLTIIQGGHNLREFAVSTARNGMGFEDGSYRTPAGRFRICEKIGEGEPVGTIFKHRLPAGLWQAGESMAEDLILTRVLRLEGLDADNANTLKRCIYIHGTNREDQIGTPASHGCIRLANHDMIELFNSVAVGDLVEILPPATGQATGDEGI